MEMTISSLFKITSFIVDYWIFSISKSLA
jgi:hypothetical protein